MIEPAMAVLEAPQPTTEPKPDWQCRSPECEQPVFGNLALCTACSILFGPYDVLIANQNVTEWIPEEHLEPPAEPEPQPEAPKPAPRRRTAKPKAKPDAG